MGTMVGRDAGKIFERQKSPGQFYRCSKARCFQTLIIRISFHHGGAVAPILVIDVSIKRGGRTIEEDEHRRIYMTVIFTPATFHLHRTRLSSNKGRLFVVIDRSIPMRKY